MARNRGGDSFVAHTESAVAPVKSSAICDYVAPRFRETATPESIISTTCAPHSGRNCRRSVRPPFERLHYFSFSLPLNCFATSLLAMTIQRGRRLLAAGANGGGI